MSWVTAAIIGGGAALVSGYMQSQAAKSAANTQAGALNRSTDIQQQQFETVQQQGGAGRAAGYNALNEINKLGSGTYGMYDAQGNPTGETGVGSGYLTKEYTPADFATNIDPGYAFRLSQGQEATNRMANMGGGMISGNALRGAQDYTQGLASTEYGNAFNRFQTGRTNIYNTLAGIAGIGQNAYSTSANAGTTAAGNIGTTIANAGAAQAGGQIGASNAISGGLQSAGNQYMLSQLLGNKTPGVNYSLGNGVGYTPVAPVSQINPDMGGAQGLQLRT